MALSVIGAAGASRAAGRRGSARGESGLRVGKHVLHCVQTEPRSHRLPAFVAWLEYPDQACCGCRADLVLDSGHQTWCNEIMEPGGPQKAKKKVWQDPIVEPKQLVIKGPLPKVVATPAVAGVGFTIAHETLAAALPTGIRALLPRVDAKLEVVPISCDYSRLLEWLRLPRFSSGYTSPDWSRSFAPRLRDSRGRVLDLLMTLVELGAEPRGRLDDLAHAWWELENMEPSAGAFQMARHDSDVERLVSVDDARLVSQEPAIASRLGLLNAAPHSTAGRGWNQRSVLSLLGYAVGWSGHSIEDRRIALRACLVMPDELVPRDQRDFWGVCCSRRRVRAIERMIGMFIGLAKHRTSGNWTRACDDWEADLGWIRAGELHDVRKHAGA